MHVGRLLEYGGCPKQELFKLEYMLHLLANVLSLDPVERKSKPFASPSKIDIQADCRLQIMVHKNTYDHTCTF